MPINRPQEPPDQLRHRLFRGRPCQFGDFAEKRQERGELIVDFSAGVALIVSVEGVARLGQKIQISFDRLSQPTRSSTRVLQGQKHRLDVHVTQCGLKVD
jgi:hypothetical protein